MIRATWRKRPDQLVRRLQRAEKKLLAEAKGAAGTIARTLQRDMAKRVKMAKTVSRQDSPGGNRQAISAINPFRVELQTSAQQATVKIDLRAHWVAARTRGVLGMLRYLGALVAATYRRGLWISPGKKRGQRARNASGPFKFFTFAANPRLHRWASRPDKGLQSKRHALLLNAKMLQALLMGPLLRKNSKKIRSAWRRLVKEWAQA